MVNPQILDLDQRVLFFPVRHHSPAAGMILRRLARQVNPTAILIEGPADFNDRIGELMLPHKLPIAIYSYARLEHGVRRGAFYPYCAYSPEWQALLAARDHNARAAFIDMPWRLMAGPKTRIHRYADGQLQEDTYIEAICRRFGVEDFNALWDKLIEVDPDLTIEDYFERCHSLCHHMRYSRSHVDSEDTERERYMAQEIRTWMDKVPGRIIVVTGGFHSHPLFELLFEEHVGAPAAHAMFTATDAPALDSNRARTSIADDQDPGHAGKREDVENDASNVSNLDGECGSREQIDVADDEAGSLDQTDVADNEGGSPDQIYVADHESDASNKSDCESEGDAGDEANGGIRLSGDSMEDQGGFEGIALTPYSYERLDALTGYEAGMPGPGFYHEVFEDRSTNNTSPTYRKLLFKAVQALRKKKQFISAADLIAVETSAQGLATLRGNKAVWRLDLIDAIITTLVKDALTIDMDHPMLRALHDVFRGTERGELAAGAALPPLVHDIRMILHEHDLELSQAVRDISLELKETEQLRRSQILHQLKCIDIAGFSLTAASDLAGDAEGRVFEDWALRWSPEFDATCIESAIYGATLKDASANRLVERASSSQLNSESAAILLTEACLMGLTELSDAFYKRLTAIISREPQFTSVGAALMHLLHLYRYDEVLSQKPVDSIGALLVEAFNRGLWLLETLGQSSSRDAGLIRAVRALVEVFERCGKKLKLDLIYFLDVFHRARRDNNQAASLRGAITGALWTLGEADMEQVISDVTYFADPEKLGDFLTGLFHLVREVVQRRSELVQCIDNLLMSYGEEEFLTAAPSLRLAFSSFTPREKHHLASTLMRAVGAPAHEAIADLEVNVATVEQVMLLESKIKKTLKKYGLRGLQP